VSNTHQKMGYRTQSDPIPSLTRSQVRSPSLSVWCCR
jgi:hypothetical protein